MDMNDKITIETMNRKNELESSVYEWRDRLNGSYKEYVNSDTAQ